MEKEFLYLFLRGKNEKSCTDFLRAERKHLNTIKIAIDLNCEEAVLGILEKPSCAHTRISAVLLGQERPGCLPLRSFHHEAAFYLTAGRVQYLFWEILEPWAEDLCSWFSPGVWHKEGPRSTPAASTQALLPQRFYPDVLNFQIFIFFLNKDWLESMPCQTSFCFPQATWQHVSPAGVQAAAGCRTGTDTAVKEVFCVFHFACCNFQSTSAVSLQWQYILLSYRAFKRSQSCFKTTDLQKITIQAGSETRGSRRAGSGRHWFPGDIWKVGTILWKKRGKNCSREPRTSR